MKEGWRQKDKEKSAISINNIKTLSITKFFTASPRVGVENDSTDNTAHNTVINNISGIG